MTKAQAIIENSENTLSFWFSIGTHDTDKLTL